MKFIDSVNFKNVVFEWDARFDRTTFNHVIFNNAIFYTIAGFSEAIFSFVNPSFGNIKSSFVKAHFKSESWFQKAIFLGYVDFENVQFDNVGHFEGAKFNFQNSKIPSFRGCKIDSTLLEFSDDSHFSQNDFSEEAIKNISFLKRLSDEHGQLDQALNFNAMELRAKRKNVWQKLQLNAQTGYIDLPSWRLYASICKLIKGEFWFCVITYLYEHISNFGRSFTCPLAAFIALAILTWLIVITHAIYNLPLSCESKQQSWLEDLARDDTPCFINNNDNNKPQLHLSGCRAAFEYSVYRTSNLVDFTDADKQTQAVTQRLFGSQIEPWWMRVYGIFKAISSSVLLFLTALGLRNKYRVG